MDTEPMTVVVVDDSPIIRAVLVKCLKLSGLPIGTIAQAGNGEEALTVIDTDGCDLLLTDIHMPGSTGLDLLDGLAERDRLDGLPVVIISSDKSDGLQDQLSTRGVSTYLSKPFTPESVRETILSVAAGGAS